MKQIKVVEDTSLFDQIANDAPLEEKLFISRSLDIAHQIILNMEQKKMLQKDLAIKLGKTEAEISRWLSGFHNFTLKTITKIEAVLGEQIILTSKQIQEEFPVKGEDIIITPKKLHKE